MWEKEVYSTGGKSRYPISVQNILPPHYYSSVVKDEKPKTTLNLIHTYVSIQNNHRHSSLKYQKYGIVKSIFFRYKICHEYENFIYILIVVTLSVNDTLISLY